jgi:hypothetical protein
VLPAGRVLSSGIGRAHFYFLDLVLDLSFLCHVAPFELACEMPPSFVVAKFFGIRKSRDPSAKGREHGRQKLSLD